MTERQGIEIDYCQQCWGVWLDRGELDKFIERNHREMAVGPQRDRAPRTRMRSLIAMITASVEAESDMAAERFSEICSTEGAPSLHRRCVVWHNGRTVSTISK